MNPKLTSQFRLMFGAADIEFWTETIRNYSKYWGCSYCLLPILVAFATITAHFLLKPHAFSMIFWLWPLRGLYLYYLVRNVPTVETIESRWMRALDNNKCCRRHDRHLLRERTGSCLIHERATPQLVKHWEISNTYEIQPPHEINQQNGAVLGLLHSVPEDHRVCLRCHELLVTLRWHFSPIAKQWPLHPVQFPTRHDLVSVTK